MSERKTNHPISTDVLKAVRDAMQHAHAFVIDACLESVRVDGFDPNQHVVAKSLRAAAESLGFATQSWLDERRGSYAIPDEMLVDDIGDEWEDDDAA